ncbi:MAG: iron-sulfur cluster assembly accessory protein [Chlamydiae bacterium]|nr:iron-sulfur cluster assembly accessory protein [Chlamydiota bacterium]
MDTQAKITQEMTIDEILSLFPYKSQKLAMALTRRGLECVGCCAATYETLEAGAYSHGISEDELQGLVGELNAILEEPQPDPNSITLTKAAAGKFLEILKEEKKEGWGLRFGDQPGGCGGYEYVLDFSQKASPEDAVFTCHGVEVHVDKRIVQRLLGSEIDYHEGLRNAGFKISNPNVRGSCGCGNSQSY